MDKFSKVKPIGGYIAGIWNVDDIPDNTADVFNVITNTNPARADLSPDLPSVQVFQGIGGTTVLASLYVSEDTAPAEAEVIDDHISALNNIGMTSTTSPGQPVNTNDNEYIRRHEYFYRPDDKEVFEKDFYSRLQDLQHETSGSKTWYIGAMFQWESTWEVWRGADTVVEKVDRFLADM